MDTRGDIREFPTTLCARGLQLLASWAATSDQTARVLTAPTDTTDTA